MARPGLEPGDEIGGYRLGEVLGAGGLGTVFATTGDDDAALAIKLVPHGLDPTIQRRVEREALALRRLDHPNVLRLIDAGATDAWSYVVMPRLAGTTLRELVAGGPLTPESAALLVMYAAHGVGAIHRAGLTHRDLKPDNVMITDDGRVVIIDLGLALAPDWTRQTTEGSIAGSLPYMAPEQIEGDAGPASDVWALGVTWWELITGRRPFARGRAVEEVAAIAAGTRPAITDVDRRISDDAAALLERCLAREPADRPADGAAVAAAIETIARDGLAGLEPTAAVIQLRRDRATRETDVAVWLARQCAARARDLAAGGDVFAAMRAVDRGLAYRPDDPAVAAALAAVLPAGAPRPVARPALAVGTPQVPVSQDAVAPTELASPRPPANAAPAPAPVPARRRRRWPWIAAGAVTVAAGATIAIVATSRTGGSGSRYDFEQPAAVFQAVIDAARTGEVGELPGLCLEREGDDKVHTICDMTPMSAKWDDFKDLFADGVVEGAYRTEDGAVIGLRYGPAGRNHVNVPVVRRRGRYYLKTF